MNFFAKIAKNTAVAGFVGMASSLWDVFFLDKKFKTTPVSKHKPQYIKLQSELKSLGVKKHVALSMPQIGSGLIAASASAPLYKNAIVVISPHEINKIYNKIKDRHQKNEVVTAILAHEAAHIKKNHKFKTIFASSLAYLLIFELGKMLYIPNIAKYTSAAFALKLAYTMLSRHYEYEADYIAAKNDSKVRDTLISLLKASESQQVKKFSFFDDHPKIQFRVDRLEKLVIKQTPC